MRRIVIFLALVAAVFSSCKLKDMSQDTPVMTTSYFLHAHVDTTWVDTLSMSRDSETGYFIVDTIAVQDTVFFELRLNAGANVLTEYRMEWDSAYLSISFPMWDDLKPYLLEGSDMATGKFIFKPGYSAAVFPVVYVPRAVGKHEVKMTLSSDSKYSPSSITFFQPVR